MHDSAIQIYMYGYLKQSPNKKRIDFHLYMTFTSYRLYGYVGLKSVYIYTICIYVFIKRVYMYVYTCMYKIICEYIYACVYSCALLSNPFYSTL